MENLFTLAERSPAQAAGRTAAAHSPPGVRAKTGEPEGPGFSEELERARKRQAEEELLAGTAALSAMQAGENRPPVEPGPPEEGVQEAGTAETANSGSQTPVEDDPVRALQAAVDGQLAQAMGEVTAAAGQVGAPQTPQEGTAVEAGSVQAGMQPAPLPETAAAESMTAASQMVQGSTLENGEQAQPVTAAFTPPPKTPPSTVELGSAASGHLLENDAALEAEAPPTVQEPLPQPASETDPAGRTPALQSARDESREAGSNTGQENSPRQSSSAAGEVYVAAEKSAQVNSKTGIQAAEPARMAEAQEPQLASQISRAVLEMTRSGESILRLQLSPEHLGPITLQVLNGPDGLRVWMSAELPATAALLESRQTDLQGTLQVNGVQLAGLFIGQDAAQDQAANWNRWQFRKQSSRSGSGLSRAGEEPGEQEIPLRRIQSESMVDYLI